MLFKVVYNYSVLLLIFIVSSLILTARPFIFSAQVIPQYVILRFFSAVSQVLQHSSTY